MPAESLPAGETAAPAESPVTPLFEAPPAAAPAPVVLPAPAADGKVLVGLPFRQPSLFSAGQLRRLRLRHEEFARALATRFCNYFRMEYAAQLLGLETMFYGKFLEGLPNPVQLTLFKLAPLGGVGLLAVPPRFGLAMVDRLCGGSGKIAALDRELSEIETALLDQAVRLLLKEWAQAVAGLAECNPELLGHETNPRFLPSRPGEAGTLALTLKCCLAEQTENLLFGLPLEMVEPLARQWPPLMESKSEPAPRAPKVLAWNPDFNAMPVLLNAEWQGLEITARQLTQLKVGDVLPIDPSYINQTRVRIARIPKFAGRLGKCGNSWAVELAEPLKT